MEILDSLNQIEIKLSQRVSNLQSSMEDRERYLINSNIPHGYQVLYNQYFDYYFKSKNIECLKRSIFLQWYAVSEPFAFTGIGDLDREIGKKSLECLADLIYADAIDNEFEGMIIHYYIISDFSFDSFIDFSSAIRLIENRHIKKPLLRPFLNRGLMGEYWNSTNFAVI